VLWVGRLTSVKNWAELLRIARLATDELPRIEFWIAGDSRVSSETDAFISLQRSLGLSNVRLFGCIPYRHMPELYALTRERQGCILSTSLSEGLQNSLLEGMASGLPVVSAAIGGNLELIEHGKNGLLYPSGNPIAGAEQVIKLLSNPDLWRQLAQDGRRAVITDYSMAKHAEAFIRVAAHLVEGGN
ncbi:MAG: glycosyltransferase family 4 protein, partial [Bacillota bacterium]